MRMRRVRPRHISFFQPRDDARETGHQPMRAAFAILLLRGQRASIVPTIPLTRRSYFTRDIGA